MAMEIKDDVFQLPITIDSNGTVTKTLQTQGTYVDKNIKVEVTTPDATFEKKTKTTGNNGEITATVSTTDTTYTSDTKTDYAITIAADAHVNPVTVGTKDAGFTASTDEITVDGADATKNTKTIYVKQGSLSGSGTASAVGANGLDLTSAGTTAPTSGYYVKASASGSVEVDTAGWLAKGTTANANGSDQYYTVASATLGNAQTTGSTYTTKNAPILVSGSGLYINEGYIENTYIPLADLVPDEATVIAGTNGNSNLIHKTVSVYDKNGALVAGTMGDAALSDITASDATATVASVTVAANADSSAFTVTGSRDITGSTSVAISTTGYATTDLKKTGAISGTATVDATIDKIALAVETSGNDGVVTPVITKEDATTASSSAITTTKPTEGHYVAVSTGALKEDVTIAAKVATAGYGTTSTFSKTDSTLTAGANASGTYYITINEASHTVEKSASEITAPTTTVTTAVNGGDVTPVIYAESAKVKEAKYVKIAASATTASGSVKTTAKCTSTEGYITAFANDIVTTETVTVANASATDVYIRVFDGSILDE